MKQRYTLFTVLALALSCLVWSLASNTTAQDTGSDQAVADTKTAADDDSHRRLPAYYNDLVTPSQRKQIYTIQDRYEEQIEELKQQLREVVNKRDAEIENVLQPEQRELLEVVKEQSRLLREARARAAARLKEKLPEDDSSEEVGN